MASAELDLPWYFGTGPATAAGDAGLKSSLGSQLDAMRAGISHDAVVDSDRAEVDMIRRLGTAHRLDAIRRRLAALDGFTVRVLRLHYSERPMAAGVSPAAVLCGEAERLCAPAMVTRERLNAIVRASLRERNGLWRALMVESATLVGEARAAYDATWVEPRRKVWGE
jgi:hypothetical protein